MNMFISHRRGLLMRKNTGGLAFLIRLIDRRRGENKPPRHAQMAEPKKSLAFCVLHFGQQIFGAPPKMNQCRAFHLGDKIFGKWKPQIGPIEGQTFNPPPFNMRRQTTAHGFDFG